MTTTYSSNPILDALEHVGHGIEVVFTDAKTIVAKLPEFITVAEDVATESPTVVAEVTAVVSAITGGSAIFDAVATALSSFGSNPAADVAVLTAVLAQAPQLGTYWTTVKTAVSALLKTLGADEATIAAVFDAPTATTTVSATTAS